MLPLYAMHGSQWVAAGRAARWLRCLRNVPNPMLHHELRSLLTIPVIGLGETSCHRGTMCAQCCAIMLSIDRMAPLYQEQMRLYGLADGCTASAPPAGASGTCGTVRQSATGSIAIAGCGAGGCAGHLGGRGHSRHGADEPATSDQRDQRVGGVPPIDSLACTMKMADLTVDRRRATGITHSRLGWFNAAPERGASSPGWLRSTARTGWASRRRRRGNVGRCSAAKPRLQLG
jgi:allantoin racemase